MLNAACVRKRCGAGSKRRTDQTQHEVRQMIVALMQNLIKMCLAHEREKQKALQRRIALEHKMDPSQRDEAISGGP